MIYRDLRPRCVSTCTKYLVVNVCRIHRYTACPVLGLGLKCEPLMAQHRPRSSRVVGLDHLAGSSTLNIQTNPEGEVLFVILHHTTLDRLCRRHWYTRPICLRQHSTHHLTDTVCSSHSRRHTIIEDRLQELRAIHIHPHTERHTIPVATPPPQQHTMATTAPAASVIPALTDRPVKNTICLFDVDGTLTPARRVSTAQATTAVP